MPRLEDFIVDVLLTNDFRGRDRWSILAFLEAEDLLTWSGSDLERDILDNVMATLDWDQIVRCLPEVESEEESSDSE